MILHQPDSTLFPYTTLFRSRPAPDHTARCLSRSRISSSSTSCRGGGGGATACCLRACRIQPRKLRSEEHTSELQSRLQLVCRLLLEKEKWIDLQGDDDVRAD